MMATLLALSYADRHSLRNALRSFRHAPWRAVAWLIWGVLVIAVGVLRATRPRANPTTIGFDELALLDLWVCGVLIAIAGVLALGGRFAGFFTSRAEALLLVRAPYPPQLVAAYLQARAIARVAAQGFTRFGFLFALTGPLHGGVAGLFRELALFATAMVLIAAIPTPRALARGVMTTVYAAAGATLALVAVIPLVRDALIVLVGGTTARAFAHVLPAWHPGVVVTAVAAGDLRAFAVTIGCAAVATAIFAVAVRDAYPELYARSLALIELRRHALTPTLPANAAGSVWSVRLDGALAFVGVDALAWLRRGSWSVSAILAMIVFGGGVLLGLFAVETNDQSSALILVAGTLPTLYVAFAATATVQLAADLRRPLFWLGGEPLVARLAAWTYAPVWRDCLYLTLFALGYGIVARDGNGACTLFLGGLSLALLARAVSAAVFALLPSAIDQRGPAVILRFFLSYALLLPTAILAVAAGLLSRSMIAGGAAAVIASSIEGAVLLAFAASRLRGGIDRLATA